MPISSGAFVAHGVVSVGAGSVGAGEGYPAAVGGGGPSRPVCPADCDLTAFPSAGPPASTTGVGGSSCGRGLPPRSSATFCLL